MAAGFGSRLRPLTDHTPKPLVQVGGRPIVDYIIDHLKQAGVQKICMNAHYLAAQISAYARARTDVDVCVSVEEDILDTGGGLQKVIGDFQGAPFWVVNGDAFWVPFESTLLDQMAQMWDTEAMDILIALQPVEIMKVTQGVGDYFIDADGRARRSLDKTGTHMFTSVRINHPRIFDGVQSGAFSYLDLLDKAEKDGRLFAFPHQGDWHHISTPDDLTAVEKAVFS